jgi:hypothetical protein
LAEDQDWKFILALRRPIEAAVLIPKTSGVAIGKSNDKT